MNPADRYSTETRTLLDLVAYEVRRLNLPDGSVLRVRSAEPELLCDLADRLQGLTLTSDPGLPAAAGIYLLSLEEGGPGPQTDQLGHAVVAFRNRLSHKTVLYRHLRSLWYPRIEREFRRTHTLRSCWGVMGPQRVGWLLTSALADRARRHDLGYYLADRALLAPAEHGLWRYVSSVGLLVGSRP